MTVRQSAKEPWVGRSLRLGLRHRHWEFVGEICSLFFKLELFPLIFQSMPAPLVRISPHMVDFGD